MKHCPTCSTNKPEAEFYRDRRKPDGLKSQCKRCHIAGCIRTRDPENHRAKRTQHMRKARAATPEKYRARERVAASAKRARHPEKVAARAALNNAVKRGDVVKPKTCESCGEERRLTGHHDDYTAPLQVRWLCYGCHGREHRRVQP